MVMPLKTLSKRAPAQSTLGTIVPLYSALSPRRKMQLAVTLLIMFVSGMAEVVSIGAVLPFLALIADPDAALAHPGLAFFMSFGGVTNTDNLLVLAAVLLIVLALAAGCIRLLLAWVSNKLVLRIGHDLGVKLYTRVLAQSYSAHLKRNSSEVLSGMEKVHTAIFALFLPVMQGLSALIIAIFIIGLLALIDPFAMSIAAAAMAIVYIVVIWGTKRLLFQKSEIAATAQTARIKQVQEAIGGIRDIIIERSHPIFIETFREIDDRYRNAQAVILFVGAAPRYIIEAAGITVIALLAVHMTQQPGGVLAAIPVLGALALGAQRLLPLFQQMFLTWSSFSGNQQGLSDLVELIQSRIDTTVPMQQGQEVRPFQRDIELRNVTFCYGDEPVLKDINLQIAKGEKIGFIGETGSGKSTLLDILMGLLEPTQGEILIDGVALDDRSRSNWQAQLAHVPQAIYLSDNSITENIGFGRPIEDINAERVENAAKRAQVANVISELPRGYATSVGERGVRLSGGQRQRLGIARALYKHAEVMVLDEATSALDDRTEKAVMAGIIASERDLTMLIVAHRLSTLAACDRIVRLTSGKISEIGSYQEIISRAPALAETEVK